MSSPTLRGLSPFHNRQVGSLLSTWAAPPVLTLRCSVSDVASGWQAVLFSAQTAGCIAPLEGCVTTSGQWVVSGRVVCCFPPVLGPLTASLHHRDGKAQGVRMAQLQGDPPADCGHGVDEKCTFAWLTNESCKVSDNLKKSHVQLFL